MTPHMHLTAPSASALGLLFVEEFDASYGVTVLDDDVDAAADALFGRRAARPSARPAATVTPPPPLPPTEAEIEAMREAAFEEGRQAGLAAAEAAHAAAAAAAFDALASGLHDAAAAAAAAAERSAEAVGTVLLSMLGAMLPATCAHHGVTEVAALVEAILPGLATVPEVAIRVSPLIVEPLTRTLERLDPDLRARVRLLPTDAVAAGDVRVAWSEGSASRDVSEMWQRVAEALAPLRLVFPAQYGSAPAPEPVIDAPDAKAASATQMAAPAGRVKARALIDRGAFADKTAALEFAAA